MPIYRITHRHHHYLFVTVQKTKYNKATTVNKHGNWLPEKPTTHQAGAPDIL